MKLFRTVVRLRGSDVKKPTQEWREKAYVGVAELVGHLL